MIQQRFAAAFALVLLVTVKLLSGPETVTIALALPEYTEIIVAEEVEYTGKFLAEADLKLVPIPVNFTPEDEECLAQNIYFEAKNQSLTGQLAVGIVTLKRVEDRRFPNSICGVVKHTKHAYANGFPVRHKCQFSWYCDGLSDRPHNPRAFEQAQHIASSLLSEESAIVDFTHGANHYHADYIDPPHWTSKMIMVARIENHIFYSTQL